MVKAGVPAEIANQIPQHVSQGEVTSVGGNLGGDLVSRLPEAVRPVIEPLLPAIINGVHEAFSTAIANAMWFGVAAGFAAALIIIVLLPELPLRQHVGEAADAGEAPRQRGRRSGADPRLRLTDAPHRVRSPRTRAGVGMIRPWPNTTPPPR